MEAGEEGGGLAVRAGGEAAPGFEPIEGARNPVAVLVERPVIGPRHPAAGSRRKDWRGAVAFNALNECLPSIGFVGNDGAGAEAGEESSRLRTSVALSSSHNQAYGSPLTIHGEMNLCRQSASGTPHSRVQVPPFPVTRLLMGAHDRAVEQEIIVLTVGRQRRKHLLPYSGPRPARKAFMDTLPLAISWSVTVISTLCVIFFTPLLDPFLLDSLFLL